MSADHSKSTGDTTGRDLRSFYEEKEAIYHSLESRAGGREKLVLELFPAASPLRILDVGCGSGMFLRILRNLGHGAVGLEISPTAVEAANQSGVRAFVGNPETDPPLVLRRLAPLLKPGGCIIASVPNLGCFTARWRILRGQFPSEPSGIFDSGHIRWFTRVNLPAYVERAGGLQLESCSATGIPPFSVRGYWRLEPFHHFFFGRLARFWPSLFGHQLVFKLSPARSPDARGDRVTTEPERGSAQVL